MAASSSSRSTPRSAWTVTLCGHGWARCCRPRATRGSASPYARWAPRNCETSIRPATPRSTFRSTISRGMRCATSARSSRPGATPARSEHLAVRRVYLGGYSQSAVDIATFALASTRRRVWPTARRSTTATSPPRMPPASRRSRPGTAWRAADGVFLDAGHRRAGGRTAATERCRGLPRADRLRHVRQPRLGVGSPGRQ